MLGFVVFLAVTEVIEGEFSSPRLGVLVHSPSMFAGEIWGYLASPQHDPAEVKLKWAPKYCMFELIGFTSPEPSARVEEPTFQITLPAVHSAFVGAR